MSIGDDADPCDPVENLKSRMGVQQQYLCDDISLLAALELKTIADDISYPTRYQFEAGEESIK